MVLRQLTSSSKGSPGKRRLPPRPIDGLVGIGEHVEGTVVGVGEKHLQCHEPLRQEILSLVDHQGVEPQPILVGRFDQSFG